MTPVFTIIFLFHCAKPVSLPAQEVNPDVVADLSMLCSRVEARSLSMWSQPVYFSNPIQSLTFAIDKGDLGARCEMGRLMEHTAKETGCPRDLIDEFMSTCSSP